MYRHTGSSLPKLVMLSCSWTSNLTDPLTSMYTWRYITSLYSEEDFIPTTDIRKCIRNQPMFHTLPNSEKCPIHKNKQKVVLFYYTSTKSWRGYIFTAVCLCVCVSVCLCVCVSGTYCEQNSSRTDAQIWTRFSLNGCFPHWLAPIEFGDLGSKVKVAVT